MIAVHLVAGRHKAGEWLGIHAEELSRSLPLIAWAGLVAAGLLEAPEGLGPEPPPYTSVNNLFWKRHLTRVCRRRAEGVVER